MHFPGAMNKECPPEHYWRLYFARQAKGPPGLCIGWYIYCSTFSKTVSTWSPVSAGAELESGKTVGINKCPDGY